MGKVRFLYSGRPKNRDNDDEEPACFKGPLDEVIRMRGDYDILKVYFILRGPKGDLWNVPIDLDTLLENYSPHKTDRSDTMFLDLE
tara:strand:+ start:263 stop:520 length:258 start_codon:yes stop_codon:yes gene_type:complete